MTGDVITRMERRVDNLVSSVRDEMKETRETMLKAIMDARPADPAKHPRPRYRPEASASGFFLMPKMPPELVLGSTGQLSSSGFLVRGKCC
nr:hypothetical protein [Methylobacterium sp. Leaf122]